MKTAISVPDQVFEAAEQLARRLGISRSELYTTAVRRFVESHDDSAITTALNEVYAAEDSELNSLLKCLQFASIEPEDWE